MRTIDNTNTLSMHTFFTLAYNFLRQTIFLGEGTALVPTEVKTTCTLQMLTDRCNG